MARERVDAMPSSRSARNSRSRLPTLTGARFVAAIAVFAFHSTFAFPFASQSAAKNSVFLFNQGGYAGVIFFFVLSGFVLTWSARPGDTAPKFWRRRFFKIYPNYVLTFLAALLLVTVVTPSPIQGWDALPNLLLVQSWFPDLGVRFSFNPVAWSLSVEALCYLLFPFLLKLIDRVRTERLWLWTVLSALSVIAVPAIAMLLPGGQMIMPQGFTTTQLWVIFDFPPTQVLTFVFGMFLARIVLAGKRLPLGLGGAITLVVGAYFISPLFPVGFQFSAVMVVPLGLFIAAGATGDIAGKRTFLNSRPMVWLGDLSFAFYLWHYLVLSYGHHWLGAGTNWNLGTSVGVMALLFGVAVLLAWATFRLLEQPMMNRFANSRRTRNRVTVTVGPTGGDAEPAGDQTDRAA